MQPMVICFSWEKQVLVASKDVYRPSIFFFPHPYPLALAVNKSPAGFFYHAHSKIDGLYTSLGATETCFSQEKQVSVAPKDVYRPSIFFFPHPYPLALAVNKSPAGFFFYHARSTDSKEKIEGL